MTHFGELMIMFISGGTVALVIHYVVAFVVLDPQSHYLVRANNYLENHVLGELLNGVISIFVIIGFVMLLVGLSSWDENPSYIITFIVGFALYCQIPLWKTWIPGAFNQLFPGRAKSE